MQNQYRFQKHTIKTVTLRNKEVTSSVGFSPCTSSLLET